MIFTETRLKGAFIIELERREDERGFFARSFCQREFEEHGMKPIIVQSGIATNRKKGTLRGMHFQFPPAAETKLVRCTRGAILDIIVDLRPESRNLPRAYRGRAQTPRTCARFMCRSASRMDTRRCRTTPIASYEMSERYTPSAEGGLPHDDPRLGLDWPLPVTAISARDRSFRPLAEIEDELRRRMLPELSGAARAEDAFVSI